MKSNFKFVLIAVLGVLAWVGCNTKYPSSYLSSTGPNPAMVINFESGLSVNPSLAEANRPGNVVQTPGNIVINGGTAIQASPGAANTAQCLQISGSVTDLGNAAYPSIQLQIPLDTAGTKFYDASLFNGVKFYIKVMGSDTAGKRSFSIPVAQTQPTSAGGDCDKPPFAAPPSTNNPCYNDFANSYNSTNGVWQQMVFPFSSFTRGSYGAAITPTTLSGANLQQILMLAWSESNNNVKGIINVNFYVDEVQFF